MDSAIIEEMKNSVDKINAPWINISYSELGGKERGDFIISLSLDKKEDWKYGIKENSRFYHFHMEYTGKLFVFSNYSSKAPKFRKCNWKSVQDVIDRINRHIALDTGN
jgi:hypothetical protein